MKVKCIDNTGISLSNYPRKPLGVSDETIYEVLEKNKDYFVMGIILGEGILNYLIDDNGIISACPYQLFDIINNKISVNWFFKSFLITENIFPYQEAIWGYYELVFDSSHYEKLIDVDERAQRIYFKRKLELEKEFM